MPSTYFFSLWVYGLCMTVSVSVANQSLVPDSDSPSHKGIPVDSNDSNSRVSWKDDSLGTDGKNSPIIDIDGNFGPEVKTSAVIDNRHDTTNYHEASGDGTMRLGLDLPPPSFKTPRNIRVGKERNETQVMIRCPPTSPFHLAGFASSFPVYDNHYDDDDTYDQEEQEEDVKYDKDALVKTGDKGIGVELDLMQLANVSVDGRLTVDVEGCGRVGVGMGVPTWADGVTFAIKGTVLLRPGWWEGGTGLKQMWVRVNGGLSEGEGGIGDLCHALPPTLRVLDVSHTPLGSLMVEDSCSPLKLHRLEATRSSLSHVSLCTPSLVDLHISLNDMGGGMDWSGCEGGLGGVQYLKATHNQLESASTHSYPALIKLDVSGNRITILNLTSVHNLTSLNAARNLLAAPPILPPTLHHLDLSHNQLTGVPELTAALEAADLSHNRVEVVGKGRFRWARGLQRLSLAHNHITQLHERELIGLRHLHTLDLSHNRLRIIAPNALQPLHHLRHLHINHNHLKELDIRTLASLPAHAHATLHHNPWYCNCHLLRQLKRLSHCKDCGHKRVSLECVEGESLVMADSVLQTCINAVRLNDESDEDLSEEVEADPVDAGKETPGAVMVVPGLVVLLLAGVIVALSYRLYHRHRRTITTRLAPFCGFCGYCAPTTINNNHESHRRDQLSQIENDSDTETEL